MKNFITLLFLTVIAFNPVSFAEENQKVTGKPTPDEQEAEADTDTNEEPESENTGKKRKLYTVEVILFRHLQEQGKNNEYWYKPQPISGTSESIPVENQAVLINPASGSIDSTAMHTRSTPSDSVPLSYQKPLANAPDNEQPLAIYNLETGQFSPISNTVFALSTDELNLISEATHLKQSHNYRVLGHFGWTQAALGSASALPVRIINNSPGNASLPQGTIELIVSRYLHLNVDLEQTNCISDSNSYNRAQTSGTKAQANNSAASQATSDSRPSGTLYSSLPEVRECVEHRYKFKQKRRMRSNELHYLDNPVFGLLVEVSPAN